MAATLVGLVLVAGCFAGQPAPTPSENPSPAGMSSTSPAEAIDELLAYIPSNETVVATLDSQHGIVTVGPFEPQAPRLSVYVDCVGSGGLSLEIEDVGSFPLACAESAGGASIWNEFDVRYVDQYSVTVRADPQTIWAMAISHPDQ